MVLDSVTQLPIRCRQASRVDIINRGKPTVDRGWMIEANMVHENITRCANIS